MSIHLLTILTSISPPVQLFPFVIKIITKNICYFWIRFYFSTLALFVKFGWNRKFVLIFNPYIKHTPYLLAHVVCIRVRKASETRYHRNQVDFMSNFWVDWSFKRSYFEFYFLTKFVSRTIFHNKVLNISVVGCYLLPFEAIVAHQVAFHPSAIYPIFLPPLCIKDITVYLLLCGNARWFK